MKIENTLDYENKTQTASQKPKRLKSDRITVNKRSNHSYILNPVTKSVHLKLLHNEMKRSKELEFKSLFESKIAKREYYERLKKLAENERSNQVNFSSTSNHNSNFISKTSNNISKPVENKNSKANAESSLIIPSSRYCFTNEQIISKGEKVKEGEYAGYSDIDS